MDIRKIAVVGGIAVGAALAFAPLASADTPITTTVDSEIASLNSLFTEETTLAGVPSAYITTGGTGVFDIIKPGDVTAVELNTKFDDLLYGFNPDNLTTDPGAYDLFNGALGEFDNAYNVGLYALENGGAFISAAGAPDDLIATGATSAALATDSLYGELSTFFDAGLLDLAGYFDISVPASLF